MNTLSWIIYTIEVVGNFKTLLLIFGLVGLASAAINIVAALISYADRDMYYRSGEDDKARNKFFYSLKWFFSILSLGIFLLVVNAVLPSQRTMILIAGSEIGERVITHDKVQSVFDPSVELLQKWIEKETIAITEEIDNLQERKRK